MKAKRRTVEVQLKAKIKRLEKDNALLNAYYDENEEYRRKQRIIEKTLNIEMATLTKVINGLKAPCPHCFGGGCGKCNDTGRKL